MQRIYDRQPTIGSQDTLDFGKHCGEIVHDVIFLFPTYIEWCICNISKFKLDEEAFREYQHHLANHYLQHGSITEILSSLNLEYNA